MMSPFFLLLYYESVGHTQLDNFDKWCKHVRIVRIGKNPDNYGILRSRTVRIGMLRMDLGPERSHAFSPLSEKKISGN